MPIRQRAILASRASTCPRDHFCRSATAPRPSRPTTWTEFLPISISIAAIIPFRISVMVCSFHLAPPASLRADRGQEHGRTIPLAVVHIAGVIRSVSSSAAPRDPLGFIRVGTMMPKYRLAFLDHSSQDLLAATAQKALANSLQKE